MIRAAALAALVTAACAALGTSSLPCPCGSSLKTDSRPTITIEIPEVECAGCSPALRKAIKEVGGVVAIAEGQPKNRIVLTYETGTSRPDAYIAAIQRAGFPKAHEVARS